MNRLDFLRKALLLPVAIASAPKILEEVGNDKGPIVGVPQLHCRYCDYIQSSIMKDGKRTVIEWHAGNFFDDEKCPYSYRNGKESEWPL